MSFLKSDDFWQVPLSSESCIHQLVTFTEKPQWKILNQYSTETIGYHIYLERNQRFKEYRCESDM